MGEPKVKSNQLKLPQDIEDMRSLKSKKPYSNPNQLQLFSIVESQPVLSETIALDRLISSLNNTPMQKLDQKLEADSISGEKDLSPFWNEYSQKISDVLWLPIQTDLCALDLSLLNGYGNTQNVNSWFSMTQSYPQSKNLSKICCPSSTASLLVCTDCENTKNKSVKSYKKTTRHLAGETKKPPNSVLKIRVFPSKELYKIWKQWLAVYRFVYNWCIAQLKKDKSLTGFTLQKMVRESNDIPEWVNQIPGHQKQEACMEAKDAFTQAKANQGEAKFKSCKATRQTISFKVGNYKNGTWYSRLTKGLTFKASQPIPFNCEYGTKLVYSRGKWFACFPTVKEEIATESSKVIALDPGNRSFLTGYDAESILEVGKNDIGRINRLCSHLDNLISKITTSPHKRQRRQMRKASYRLREKINSLVKDLHNKVSHYLTSNYKVIFLPTFETSEMVLKSQRKINRKSARNLLTWSHYKFSQHLTQMAKRKNVLVIRLSEAYTSKTCGHCGHIHKKLGGAKVFKCPNCQTSILRDVNGARNIMLRALQAVAFTVSSDVVLKLKSSN